jgi:Zn-dependent M28 family amino/carboxypeptidase
MARRGNSRIGNGKHEKIIYVATVPSPTLAWSRVFENGPRECVIVNWAVG